MLIGARESISRGADNWENPYVTDNLIAMWDGIWNAGGGVNDPSSHKWKDLAGSYDVYTNASNCNGTFTTNGLVCHGDKLAAKGELGNILPFNVNAEIEVVITFPNALTTQSNFLTFFFHGGGAGSNDPQYTGGARNVLMLDTRSSANHFDTAFVGGGYAAFRFNGSSIAAGTHSIRYPKCAYPGRYGSISANRPWLDNVQVKTTVDFLGGSAWGAPGNYLTFGGGQNADGSLNTVAITPNGIVINAIRWYSSVLTTEQWQHNYALDKERFKF